MQLSELNLNRFLYRDVGAQSPDNATTNVYNNNPAPSGGGTPPPPPPGSIITSVILQSSPSDNRIEIDPDDTLKAYNNGNVILLIDKNGIVADNADFDNAFVTTLVATTATITTGNVTTLNVTTKFNYFGIAQPVVYSGVIANTGFGSFLPAGWTSILVSTGIYRITHNLNTFLPFLVFLTPITGHFRGRILAFNQNYFDVSWQQTSYGSATFPVSGGPGSVTVSQVRIPPYEEPVNVGFEFLALRYLP